MKKKNLKGAVAVLALLLSLVMMTTCVFAAEGSGTVGSEAAGALAAEGQTADRLAAGRLAAEAQDTGSLVSAFWADSIDEMLEGRQYKEGEVVVVYDNFMNPAPVLPGGATEQEEIGVASGEAAEETFGQVEVSDTEDAVSVRVITSETKTTRELLEELAADPSVISAEPNYIYELPEDETEISDTLPIDETEISEAAPADEAEISEPLPEDETGISEELPADEALIPGPTDETSNRKTDGQTEASPSDETVISDTAPLLQNGTDSETMGSIFLTGEARDYFETQSLEQVGDLSYLQWGYGETDAYGHYSIHSPNWNAAGGTNVSPEKEAVVAVVDSGIDYTHPDLAPVMVDMTKYGMDIGGKYGYNSSGDGDETDPMDNHGHGTHCAGIIAAAWNGLGTSGVASGVKLCAVRASSNGGFSIYSVVKAFMYLAKACDRGMNLKSVNCSFGGDGLSNTQRLLVNELGRRGAVVCYASGNSTKDNDKNPVKSSAEFNSPYALVVNAANPTYLTAEYSDFGKDTTALFSPGDAILAPVCEESSRYLPSADLNRKAYDTFAPGEEDGVQVMYLGTMITEKGTTLSYTKEEFLDLVSNWEEAGVRVTGSESFDNDGCSYEIQVPQLGDPDDRAIFLVSVPVDEADASAISNFGLSLKSTLSKSIAWIRPVFYDYDENVRMSVGGTDGWLRPSDVWCSFDVPMETDGLTGYPYYNGRMFFFIMLSDYQATSRSTPLYLDCVGGGTDILRYAFFQGTSMATPAVTGSVAVMFEQLEQEGSLAGLSPAEQAAAVVDAIKASTLYCPAFDTLCSSCGALDFAITKENYTPVIHSVTISPSGVLTVQGNYFGTKAGILLLNGFTIAALEGEIEDDDEEDVITGWSDTEITVQLAQLRMNGLQDIEVYSANGKKTCRSMILNGNNGKAMFEGKIALPEAIHDSAVSSMFGLSGKVYLVPETLNSAYTSPQVAEQLWCYDPASDTWKQCKSIPVPEEITSGYRAAKTELNASGNFLIAQVTYAKYPIGEFGPSGMQEYTERVYFYNPAKDTWTEADFGTLEVPNRMKVFGTDNGVFLMGGYWVMVDDNFTDEDGTVYYKAEMNTKIYSLQFDSSQVEAGKPSVSVTALKEAGTCEEPVNDYASIQTIGNSTVVASKQTIWLNWLESEQKFQLQNMEELSLVFEAVGKEFSPVQYISAITCGANTPFGPVFAGMPGNAYTGRGFDTFFLGSDGTVTAYDKYVSFADLYNSLACYTEGYLFVWGDSYYNQDTSLGYMAYTKLVKQVTPEITLGATNYTYDGKVKTPSVSVKADGQPLKEGRDYTVSYEDGRINAGTYKVSVTLKGSYEGSASASFTISPKKVTPSVTLSKTEYKYNGKVKNPSVTVKADGRTLVKDTDYSLTYPSGRKNAGTYKVSVSLKGNYSGSASTSFIINKAANTLKVKGKTANLSFKKLKSQNLTLAVSKTITFTQKGKGTVTYQLASAKKGGKSFKSYFKIAKKTGKMTVKRGLKKGTYKVVIKVSAAGGTNYKAATKSATVTVKVK